MYMKIAVPSRNGEVDSHFGHCEYFTVFSLSERQISAEETLSPPPGCGCKSNIADSLAERGVRLMLAGNMGQGAVNKLAAAGITVIRGCSGPVRQAVEDYAAGKLTDAPVVCSDHGSCPGH
jgi:predicted Fe-Mo cluster-binding NifX family protein